LLRYAPNAAVPRHIHHGFEHILVLSGSQRDDHGTYTAGTMLVSTPGSSHAISSEEGCVVLAIWEKPVEILEG
jgi:anti-sigma factor ChrR (cupin superfamily)